MLLRDHRVVHRKNAGFADLATRQPIDDQTIFHWASITKTFTAIAIVQMRDRGLLSLDDPIVKPCPSCAVHNPRADGCHHAAHVDGHTAGFRGVRPGRR